MEACHTSRLWCLVRATAQPHTAGLINFSADTYTNAHTSLCARCRPYATGSQTVI